MVVVPHAGTWIEINDYTNEEKTKLVVPHAGTWIEIIGFIRKLPCFSVVPHAGTWIEIKGVFCNFRKPTSRSPRGNVD